MTALGDRPGCDVRVSQGTRGSRGEYWSAGCALSPQVDLIPDRKCNAGPELRQNKSTEFKISSFFTPLAVRPPHEKTERDMSGLVVSSALQLLAERGFLSSLVFLVDFN